MSNEALSQSEQLVEEIRQIRRRLFSAVGTDYRKLREMVSQCPEGYRYLQGVRPVMRLSQQLAKMQEDEAAESKKTA